MRLTHPLTLAALLLTSACHAQNSATPALARETAILSTAPTGAAGHHWTQPPFGGQAADLHQAFRRSCGTFAKKPASAALSADARFGTYGQWQAICRQGLALPSSNLEAFLNTRLTRIEKTTVGGTPEAKFTGYYQPILQGSRTRHGPYQTPLVKFPADLTRNCPSPTGPRTGQKQPNGSCTTPYPSRAAIDAAIEAGSPLYRPILWLKDPVDAYFLQIQGSGTVELDDGPGQQSLAYVGFAGKNGHPYVAIGKTMKQWGYLSGSITAAKIRNWLATASTASATEVYHSNPSFIFFRETQQSATGALGVPLVPGRSLAVDKSVLPLGVPVFVDTHLTHDDQPWRRIMFAHDVGSAIVGHVRGDIFFGGGPLAAERAGDQNASGRLYLLVPTENVTKNTTPTP